jgi:16S rRNA (cytidine1402-2'-O)-methyltransferase
LIPVALSNHRPGDQSPQDIHEIVPRLRHFIAENAKSARAWLKQIAPEFPVRNAIITVLDEHTPSSAIRELLAPVLAGEDIGLVSEAGCPAVADPGAELVSVAHALGIAVVPMIGPSSIMLGLMASGLNGQRFVFHGYLPQQSNAREIRLKEIEQRSRRFQETQIFIETPYRNSALLASILSLCEATTRLCLAVDLTAPTQFVMTRSVAAWRTQVPDLHRRPTVFLLLAAI